MVVRKSSNEFSTHDFFYRIPGILMLLLAMFIGYRSTMIEGCKNSGTGNVFGIPVPEYLVLPAVLLVVGVLIGYAPLLIKLIKTIRGQA